METITTQQRLAQSLKQLMYTSPLEKITVTQIVADCQLTRQTFYRHFGDKYALVNWCFASLVQDCFQAMEGTATLRQALEQKFFRIEQEQTFFRSAFKTQCYGSLIEYDYRYIFNFFQEILQKTLGETLGEARTFSLELYCHGVVAQTVAWVYQERRPTPKEMATLLELALPENLNMLGDLD